MDQKLLFLINRAWTSPALDRAMAVFSSLDFWLPLLVLGGLALAILGGFRGRAFLLTALLSTALSDGVIGNSLKRLVHRPRPAQAIGGVRQIDLARARPRLLAVLEPVRVLKGASPTGDDERGRSFPSSHTTNTFAAALVAALFFPRRGWVALIFAALVAYSRIYTGSHWPSDIAASIFLGAGIGLLTVVLAEIAWHLGARRWWSEEWRRHPSLLPA